MTDQDPTHRGKDFLIGFLPSAVVVGGSAIMMISTESVLPPLWACGGLTTAALVAVALQRPLIGLGIFATLAAVPVLLIGTCFAMFSGVG